MFNRINCKKEKRKKKKKKKDYRAKGLARDVRRPE